MTKEELDEAITDHAAYPMTFTFAHQRKEPCVGAYNLTMHGGIGTTVLPPITVDTPLYEVTTVTVQRLVALANLVAPLIDRLKQAQAERDTSLEMIHAMPIELNPSVRYRVLFCENNKPDQVLLITASRQAAYRHAGACLVAPGCWVNVQAYLNER